MSRGYLNDGKRYGQLTDYYENGQIKEEGNIKPSEYNIHGEPDGKWTYYNEDGSIDKVQEYKMGYYVE